MPRWLVLGFQDRASIRMGELSCLHDHVMTIILSVIIFITYVMTYILVNSSYYKFLSEGTFIETIWSMVPAFLLIILVLPSIKVLYMIEDIKSPVLSFKIVAHQWYWRYVVPLFKNFSFLVNRKRFSSYEFDSIIEDIAGDNALEVPRLLNCSSDFFLPVNTTSRLLITSTDVIHSFALPTLGLKVDALPGRINQLFTNPSRVGLYFGQCSEICGSNHSFIPISIKVCSVGDYDRVSKSYLLDILGDSFSSSYKL